jgi:hypothetical protein
MMPTCAGFAVRLTHVLIMGGYLNGSQLGFHEPPKDLIPGSLYHVTGDPPQYCKINKNANQDDEDEFW